MPHYLTLGFFNRSLLSSNPSLLVIDPLPKSHDAQFDRRLFISGLRQFLIGLTVTLLRRRQHVPDRRHLLLQREAPIEPRADVRVPLGSRSIVIQFVQFALRLMLPLLQRGDLRSYQLPRFLSRLDGRLRARQP